MSLQAEPRRRGIVVPIIFVLVTCAALVSLGTWQLERKSWKEGLIAELESKLSAQPVALPPREQWPQLSAATDEFRRVMFPAEFLDQEALVYTSGSALRPDVSGPGYWVLSPARLSDGQLAVVNRGFVPEGKQDPNTRREGQPHGVTEVVGTMRWPEPRGMFTPNDTAAKNLWFVRDPAAGHGWRAVALSPLQWQNTAVAKRTVQVQSVAVYKNGALVMGNSTSYDHGAIVDAALSEMNSSF